ncbi:hypothetical protein Emtol_0149 (plasmid) [Emticicia oligotrophica DSM 17448]|uniref:Cytochrome C Planctomycete-type domain-containing protein n=1 Tax=Emticicia oligotrophica (strain DSM 17448 / CIP 109782 / MTCC 6937 / GPTSA100-15) TaxID=929562 RepID=A0ABM5N884_EMTOG|nr:c-type cytochrome domain-containing protein [Emticicia oligotrophica]AFK05664.1 hypothetical protein Emtol_0149 [Emticicia oligotrophica DSM 17448]
MLRVIILLAVGLLNFGCYYKKNASPNPASNTGPSGEVIQLNCVNTSSSSNTNSETVCFDSQVLPFFQTNCAMSGCHDSKTREEGYDLSSYSTIIKRGINTSKPTNSELYKVIVDTGRDRMPPPPRQAISKQQSDMILKWIQQGAKETACGVSVDATNPTFAKVIKPIIDVNCLGCHQSGSASGNIVLDSYNTIKQQVDNGRLWGSIAQLQGFSPMPQGRKLSDCELTAFKNWIDKGAKND